MRHFQSYFPRFRFFETDSKRYPSFDSAFDIELNKHVNKIKYVVTRAVINWRVIYFVPHAPTIGAHCVYLVEYFIVY